MELDGGLLSSVDIPFKVMVVDLLLSGDNAVLIALACRSLPPVLMQRAILMGTAAAIFLRFALTLVIGSLLTVPWLKLAGAAALLFIAIKLIMQDDEHTDGDAAQVGGDLWAAVRLIIIADLVMSFDNVVALAAVARGSIGYLALGLFLSVPLLVYGSTIVARWLNSYPLLITGGGALLAWVAGDLAVSDPVINDWIEAQAFALKLAVPLACAIFAVHHSRLLSEQRRAAPPSDAPSWSERLQSLKAFLDDQLTSTEPVTQPQTVRAAPKPKAPEPLPAATAPPETPKRPKTMGDHVLVIVLLIAVPLIVLAIIGKIFMTAAGL